MKLSYRKIGDQIRLVDERNIGLKVENLLGLSISKEFIPSVANTIGTDMENYKIIKKNQFACSVMQVRRDKKIPVALLGDIEQAILSQAYPIFEVTDTSRLLPEYLMMWFSRSEFDREACFHAIGGVRGSLEWEDFCNMELPIPSVEKQKEMVIEYKIIQNQIILNQKIIKNLESLALSIYKYWFVDFEFPDKNGVAYLSNGGMMVWNEEKQITIPEGWINAKVKGFCKDMKSGGTPSRNDPTFWDKKEIPWLKTGEIKNNIIFSTEEFISQKGLANSSAKILPNDTVLMSMYGVNAGDIAILKAAASTNQACCGMICDSPAHSAYLYYHLLHNQSYIRSQSIGGAQENLSKDFVEKINILIPPENLLQRSSLHKIIRYKEIVTRCTASLERVAHLLLSKMATIKE